LRDKFFFNVVGYDCYFQFRHSSILNFRITPKVKKIY
jgi:hypothetical protein